MIDENSTTDKNSELKIKEIFLKYNAMDQLHTMSKQEIFAEIDKSYKKVFVDMQYKGLIKKYKGKFYYSEDTERHYKIADNSNISEASATENTTNSKFNSKNDKTTAIVVVLICVIFIGILIYQNITAVEDEDGSSETSDVIELGEDGICIQLPSDLTSLTAEEIDSYYGTGASDYYQIVAFSSDATRSVIGFIINKDELDEEITAQELLEQSFEGEENISIEVQDIASYEFYVVNYEFNYSDIDYSEKCMVYDSENQFVCLDIIYPIDETAIDAESLIFNNLTLEN